MPFINGDKVSFTNGSILPLKIGVIVRYEVVSTAGKN